MKATIILIILVFNTNIFAASNSMSCGFSYGDHFLEITTSDWYYGEYGTTTKSKQIFLSIQNIVIKENKVVATLNNYNKSKLIVSKVDHGMEWS
jgi:hypothetical protein